VLVAGCLLEGETILVLAGFAAHRGYLNPFVVVAIAAVIVGLRIAYGLGIAGSVLIEMSPIWPRAGREGTITNRGEPSSC